MTEALREPAERAWALLRQFAEAHNRHGELADALGFGLGAGRGKVLLALRSGPMTLSAIAEAHGFDAPYATLVADKLESHGLVVRRAHPHDRRRKLVTLTDRGEAAIATVDEIQRRPPDALTTLSPAELDQLIAVLSRLDDAQRRPIGDPSDDEAPPGAP